ncbi:hypothetical protein [Bacillus sp. V5-8f]|uniref:hypothetical protein n=1 Tax=Bacillus sp. V5-8f TaxID=2053044 RepID=UPI000C77CC33|nr:hypothetical protein [Bacillus sp. V5-8f]PLT33080.1 hypothetical protein CUU64_14940 [Bacillus sp. V5-8f]
MDIRLDVVDHGLTDVIMNVEGIDYEIGSVEEHPTAEGYFRAYGYNGSLLESSKDNFVFVDFDKAVNSLMEAFDGMPR